MCLYCSLVGVKTHEKSTGGSELVKIGGRSRDEGLDLRCVCQVAQVAEDRHETLGFEWE